MQPWEANARLLSLYPERDEARIMVFKPKAPNAAMVPVEHVESITPQEAPAYIERLLGEGYTLYVGEADVQRWVEAGLPLEGLQVSAAWAESYTIKAEGWLEQCRALGQQAMQ